MMAKSVLLHSMAKLCGNFLTLTARSSLSIIVLIHVEFRVLPRFTCFRIGFFAAFGACMLRENTAG